MTSLWDGMLLENNQLCDSNSNFAFHHLVVYSYPISSYHIVSFSEDISHLFCCDHKWNLVQMSNSTPCGFSKVEHGAQNICSVIVFWSFSAVSFTKLDQWLMKHKCCSATRFTWREHIQALISRSSLYMSRGKPDSNNILHMQCNDSPMYLMAKMLASDLQMVNTMQIRHFVEEDVKYHVTM